MLHGTPRLNAIIGYSELLTEEAEEAGQAHLVPDLEKIRGAGKHLLALINNILDLSKIEAGKMDLLLETFEVAPLPHEVCVTVQPLIKKNANVLKLDVGPQTGLILADSTKLRQMLLNLLGNAAKFSRCGGRQRTRGIGLSFRCRIRESA